MNVHVTLPGEETAETGAPSAIVPRATVDSIVGWRDRALALFGEAYVAIGTASDALTAAWEAERQASGGKSNTRYNHHLHEEKAHFIASIKVPERETFMATARKIVDTDVWSHVIQITDLERLMDKKAKDQLYQQLLTDPPEATVDNILATLHQFTLDAATIWKRGIAECFSGLDRRFRSHDGWKIGSRIILTHAFNEYGSWNWNRDQSAAMADVDRVFRLLDEGMGAPLGYSIVDAINAERGYGHGARQSVVESEYFTVRVYKNGNAHIWFKRDDLVEKVNQLLGEYYGAPIPEDRDPDPDTGLYDAKTTPAKRYGFFPTPDDLAPDVVKHLSLLRPADKPPLKILEPSAGTGNLARLCFDQPAAVDPNDIEWRRQQAEKHNAAHRFDHQVDCVEIQPHLVDALKAEGIYRNVYGCNFLSLSPETTGLYDRIVMNPPFDRERDIDHVLHALDFLEPDGELVAIMSAGTEFRQTRKSKAFRQLMREKGAWFDDLPAGSFASVGTYVNAIVVRIHKAGDKTRWSYGDLRKRFTEVE